MKYYTIKETREFMENIGIPGGNLYDLPTSEKRFPDGGQYSFEDPDIHSQFEVTSLMMEAMSKGEF